MRSGFWRKCRVCFRWLRISAWLVVLAALCAVVWLNQIGLPDFLKTRLVATLRERGVEVHTFDSEQSDKGEGGPTCMTRPIARG